MIIGRTALSALGWTILAAAASGQTPPTKPLSPRGTTATQVGGTWTTPAKGAPRYDGGKWIEVEYGRPILRGRKNIFGTGSDYGKTVNSGAPVWRAGAGVTTKLSTETAIMIGGKTLPPGTYDVFVELKESAWTLILSTQKTQEKYDPNEKVAAWGSFNYDPKFDVARAPMKVVKRDHSIDQFTIAFLDMSDSGGTLAMAWENTWAGVEFSLAH